VARLAGAAMLAFTIAVLAAACGGGSGSNSNSSKGSSSGVAGASTTSTSGKTFGTLKVVWGDTDYMDPGLSYRLESWQLFQNIYEGLVGQKHASGAAGAEIVPVLAQNMPLVNKTGTVYKFTLRKGLKYSNGTPIKASDFGSTIVRDFKLNSPGVGFYANVVGADPCEKNPTSCSHISGIVTNNTAGTVTIKLKKPESDFLMVLSLPFSAFVPASTPSKPTQSPPPPSAGPYYIAKFQPHKSFLIKRNPYYRKNAIPTVPQGNPNQVVGTIMDDLSASAQQVVSGQADYDENLLPSDRLAQLQKKYSSQIKFFTTPSTYYFFMNERLAPFNNLKARQAVNYAIDRSQLVKLRGGLGVPTQNFLPPTYPSYKKLNVYTHNLAKAKQLVKQSGTKGMTVTVYTISDVSTDKAMGEYLQGVLKQIGWNAKIRELSGGNYFVIVGNQSTKAQIGFTDWFQDYPYPSDWFNILQNGRNITSIHNNNNSNVNIPAVNKQIDRLDSLPPSQANSESTNKAWANLDRTLMVKYATEAPFLTGLLTDFFGNRMNPGCDVFDNFQADFAQFCLK
jgi:peptide/nickel transport system substrate-binding protein